MRYKKILRSDQSSRATGFTLIELLVAMAVFLVVSGAAFSLFATHQPLFNQQQNLAEVNIALRNSIAQMQLDIANAGANYYSGINVPNYPVGVVVTNNVVAAGGNCSSGTPVVYGVNCFDSLSIITADSNTLPTNPSNGSGGCAVTSTSTLYLDPTGSASYATAAAATAAATHYLAGDQILIVNSDGSQYTTVKLTVPGALATVGGNFFVMLTHGLTTSVTDTGVSPSVVRTGYNAPATPAANGNDPYGMTNYPNAMLGEQYCSSDYVLRITPIQYSVDLTTDPNNPALIRTVAGTAQTISQRTIATQIIGFKLGVSLLNNVNDTDTTTYNFNAATYNNGNPVNGGAIPYNYTLIRSVMVSLIGRTKPTTDPAYVFRNSFDNGAYEIQGVSAVINPRNMSMND